MLTATTRMTTRTDGVPASLRLMWLASPALPIGAFSYSEGLESAVEHDIVRDEAGAADWLSAQLALLARGDMAALAEGIQAWQQEDEAALAALSTWIDCTRDGAEARLQSEQMGQSLLHWARGQGLVDALSVGLPHYVFVMARVLATLDLPLDQVLRAQAFGWAENQVQAALKAVPLGQSAGQRVLARLATEIPAAVARAMAAPIAERQIFAPMLSILAARHETQYSRLFRS